MDKIDEWMKRAFEEENQKEKSPQNKKKFQHSHPNQKKKSFAKGKKAKQIKPAQPHKAQPKKGNSPQKRHKPQKGRQPQKTKKADSSSIKPAKKALKPSKILRGKLKIIPLGGLNEVGKNMMALEYENDILIIDMGFEFPGEDMLGIDYVIPDVTYLEENRKRIVGVVLTHGHLDHIGGIPYINPKLDFPPLYGTKLTLGLVQKRVEEFKQEQQTQLRVIDPDKPLRLGKFMINFFRVAHSIPDAVGLIIDTPVGKIVHTGDFKFDNNPAGIQKKPDMHKIKALGNQNVLAMFSDSTNALKPGHTMSEEEVGKTLEDIIKNAKGRLIIASFSSLIGRIQQILDYATKHNRKVFISGRSLRNNIDIAARLGYLNLRKIQIEDIKKYKGKTPDDQTLILTTGSQGESVSALTRIANGDHPHIKIKKGDQIILSSSPIVGNERAIATVINNLCLLGANVIHNQIMDVHTSGHGYRDELIQMIKMVKPKYFLPVHGEYFMRQGHQLLAQQECGMPENRTIMLQNGDVLICEQGKVTKAPESIETKYILIDGLGEGHVGSRVLVDRQIMSQNGSLVVLVYIDKKTGRLKKNPDVISRGFIYMHETGEIAERIAEIAREAYKNIRKKNPGANRKDIKKYIKQTIDKFTHSNLERRPLIVPLIVEG